MYNKSTITEKLIYNTLCTNYIINDLHNFYLTIHTFWAKAMITFPRLDKDLFIFWVSVSLTPSDPDFFNLSEPAKSTKFNVPKKIFRYQIFLKCKKCNLIDFNKFIDFIYR